MFCVLSISLASCRLGSDRADTGPTKEEINETIDRQNEYYRNMDSASKKEIMTELDSMEALINKADKDEYIEEGDKEVTND